MSNNSKNQDIGRSLKAAKYAAELKQRGILFNNQETGVFPLSFAGTMNLTLPDGSKVLWIPDTHHPANDPVFEWMLFELVFRFKPAVIVLIGDDGDFFGLGAWDKDPLAPVSMRADFEAPARFIRKLRAISGATIIVIPGNHNDRMRRAVMSGNPGFAKIPNLKTMQPIFYWPALMGFEEGDGVHFVMGRGETGGKDGRLVLNDQADAIHGLETRAKPGQSPWVRVSKYNRSQIHGHTHRLGMVVKQTTDGQTVVAMELGHNIDPSRPEFDYVGEENIWHPGFGASRVHNDTVEFKPIAVINDGPKGKAQMPMLYYDGFIVGTER